MLYLGAVNPDGVHTAVTGAAAVFAAMTLLWIASMVLGDVSIVDIFWGLGFVLIGGIAFLSVAPTTIGREVLAAMVAFWGSRLAIHLFIRNRGKGEDYR